MGSNNHGISFGNDKMSSEHSSAKVKRKASKGPTILGMGSRSAFPPTMPDQVLCKQNQRAHMEWQREQWMAERERALKRDSKEISEANTATMEACTIAKVQQTDAMDKQVDELLEWVDGIDVDSDEEVEKYDLETIKQGGRS